MEFWVFVLGNGHDGYCGKFGDDEEEVWLNESGDVVENKEDTLGMKTKYILKHPTNRKFADVVGSNINQEKDGQKGVRKRYV